MEHNRRLLGCNRKIRSFRMNFEKMIAVAQYNMVQILDAGNFRIFDVLEGHATEIKCMDVSQISKAVVSFSAEGLLLIHAPLKTDLADHVISLNTFKWKEYWRLPIKLNVRNMSISPIGDFFSMSGDGFITVWVRDTPVDFTYSQFVYYAREEPKNVIAQVISHKPNLGFIIQQEISNDGRLIFCLESRSTVKVYYQDKLQRPVEKAKEEEKISRSAQSYQQYGRYGGGGMMRYGQKDDRVDVVLEYNPYANIDNGGAALDNMGGGAQRTGDLRFQQDELVEYCLPKHQNAIEYFKLLHHDIYECEKRYLPNYILTVTSRNEVFLWQENLMCPQMQFTCVHAFRGYSQYTFFDAAFLDFPPINPKRYVELKANVSRLFDTTGDRNLQLKKDDENVFGIFKQNYVETSIDWIIVLNDQIIDIFKVEGLRNFPLRTVTVQMWNRVKLNANPRDFFGACKIIAASCRDFNDILSLYTLNTAGQLIKLRKDFKEHSSSNDTQGKWKVDKVAILKRKYITAVAVHKHLPLMAHVMNDSELYFFIEEKTKNRLVKESLTGGYMRFLGAYSVYHTKTHVSTLQLKTAPQAAAKIIRAKWVNSALCMLIVQFSNDTLALVASQSQLRILSHKRQQEEYMKLWESTDKSRQQINEKWMKLYEVHFNQAKKNQGIVDHDHSEEEHIVNYEIINCFTIEGGFQVNLAIFTSFNQYLVFETQTTLLANLKTLSQTKLLYHMYTTDCTLQLLSCQHYSANGEHPGGMGARTVLALLTEVDPKRQRKELQKKEEINAATSKAPALKKKSSNPYEDSFSEDEDGGNSEDEGDIFAQFTNPGGKKKENQTKQKTAQVTEAKKIEEPLKHQIVVKMVQFDDESYEKKQFKELWKVELPLDFKQKIVSSKGSENFFAFMTQETDVSEDQFYVYIYDMMQQKYLGFINITKVIGQQGIKTQYLDFIFSAGTTKGSITVYYKDSLYLIAESSREGRPGKWSLIKRIDNVMGLGKDLEIKSIMIKESFLRKQILLVNQRILSVREKYTLKEENIAEKKPDFNMKSALGPDVTAQEAAEEGETKVKVTEKQALHHIFTYAQKSLPLFNPKVLKSLYVKGYVSLVLKMLVQLNKCLDPQSNSLISEFLDFDIGQIMEEVNDHIQAMKAKTADVQGDKKKKQETASSIFDDFYGGGGFDNDFSSMMQKKEDPNKNEQNKKIQGQKVLEQEFEDCFQQLLQKVRNMGEKALGLNKIEKRIKFVDFLKRFQRIYKKEFFADDLTSQLLRDLYFDTEDIQEDEELKVEQSAQQPSKQFNVAEFISQMKAAPSSTFKANLANLRQWTSLQTCQALHSEMQDVLLNELQERFDFESNLNYDLMKKLCIPVWIKDTNKLKDLVSTIAKNEYKQAGDDFGKASRAEKTALWYILINRKDHLVRLYKQETAFKKVYELLLNDFTVPKYKTIAEKNALVLMSKKNYLLCCAFFILAGSLRDAIKVALDKMNDPVLALLMARLQEKEVISGGTQPAAFDDSSFDIFGGGPSSTSNQNKGRQESSKNEETWQEKIYLEWFIQRGQNLEDPYLQNIGYWQRKEYIKAVNAFHIDPAKLNTFSAFFNHQMTAELNLYYSSKPEVHSEDKQKQLLFLAQQQESSIQENIPVPYLSTYDFHVLDFLKALRKSTTIKRVLQENENKKKFGGGGGMGLGIKSGFGKRGGLASNPYDFGGDEEEDDDQGGGDSIFDDFFGGGGATSKKKTSVKKNRDKQEQVNKQVEEKDQTIIVDDSKVIEFTVLRASQTGFILSALVIMNENIENLDKVNPVIKKRTAYSLLSDMINQPTFQYQSIKQLKSSLSLLIDKLGLNKVEVRSYILNLFKNNDNFIMLVNFIAEEESELSLYDAGQQMKQQSEALQSVEEQAMKMIDFVHTLADFPFALVDDGKSNDFVYYMVKKAVAYLEGLAESYIIVDTYHQEQERQLQKSSPAPNPAQGDVDSPVASNRNNQPQKPSTKHTISMTIAGDLEDEEGNYEFTVEEEKGNLNLKNLDLQNKVLRGKSIHIPLSDELETALQNMGSKTRITLVLYLGLIQVSIISRKFSLVKELLSDLKNIFSNTSTLQQDKDQSQVALYIQKLKTNIQKFKYSLKRKVEDQDDFETKFNADKPKTKEQIEEERRQFKIDHFFGVWLQYIITHYVLQLVRFSYENSQLKGLIDYRPSIADTHPMSLIVEYILNPRISSSELLKKFVNMDRILENVTTYYFENFLNLTERYIISNDLQNMLANRYDITLAKYLVAEQFFANDKRFSEFAAFVDIGSFIRHLRDHELSLVYHTNRDYNQKALDRTQEIFEDGIEIFRVRNENVLGFAFDHCDMDLVALSLQGKGTREVSIRKSLLYRTRSMKGHQVIDEESGGWFECLHRYDKVAQEHGDIKPQSSAIIAAIERMYQYKTINYAKKQRRHRENFLLDYEMNPPDEWSGYKSSEFSKNHSELDLTHDDYSNAIESHPYLPLFVTGNARGQLCLWEFNQAEDRSLDQWNTDPWDSIKASEQKKATIKKLLFNSYGDKMYCSNMDGSIFAFNFDNLETSRTVPIYSLKRVSKEEKISDFELLSSDTVFAVSAIKPKHLWVYDTLLSSRGGLILESQIGGSIIKSFRSKSQLLLFNSDKPGTMSLFDLKMNRPILQTSIHTEEVTSVDINEAENTLIAGFKDGLVKIFNMDKEFEVREAYQAVGAAGNKKGSICQVRVHPTNGAVYVSSTIGNLKLFRTRV